MTTDDTEAFFPWVNAYSQWLKGNCEPMAAWLTDPQSVITEDARQFLADLVRGKIKRPRGRRAARQPREERAIVAEVFTARERHARNKGPTGPHDRAISEVALARKMNAGVVLAIVGRLNNVGVTFEAWKRWGRPTFV